MAKRKFENMSKQLRVSLIVGSILLSSTGVAKAYELDKNNVELVIDGESVSYTTAAQTVAELLEKEEIDINDLDNISVSLDDEITDDMRILINRANNIKIIIDNNENETIKTGEVTVGRLLLQYKKQTGNDFVLDSDLTLSSKLKNNMTINLKTVKEETSVVTETIPFETITVENNKMAEGSTNVKTQGENGSRDITSKITYIGGKIDSTEIISNVVTKEPINEVVEKGTAKVIETSAGTFISNNVINMKASAYTASSSCTGKNPGDAGYGITASGMKAKVGVVAVDEDIIPLGTKLYIEGYGFAVAGDTGGAIKGHKIDLFVNSYSEAINFGIQNRKVYILGEKIS